MKFIYHQQEDISKPLAERLGEYPRHSDFTWDCFRWLGCWLSVLFVRCQFNFTKSGDIPKNERVAIVANHQSHLDTATILAALPYQRRKDLIVLAAEDYFFKKTSRAMLASLLCQGVSFERMHWISIRDWYKHLQAMQSGWLLFYPTGSRHSTEIQPGLLKILLKEGWSILPVHLEGVDEAWPSHSHFWKPFKPLKAQFFEPYCGNDINELLERLNQELYPL